MTERKICEYTNRFCECGDGWIPLDPQPCCANCGHAELTKYADLCVEIDGRIPELSFYCKYWERKE